MFGIEGEGLKNVWKQLRMDHWQEGGKERERAEERALGRARVEEEMKEES